MTALNPERERKKRELRGRLETERQLAAQTKTVERNLVSVSTGTGQFVLREDGDIRPARPIAKEDVRNLNARFWNLKRLSGEKQFKEVCEIGFRLRCWQDLFSSEQLWNAWRGEHLRIPRDAILWLIRVWDNHEKLKWRRKPTVRFQSPEGRLTPALPAPVKVPGNHRKKKRPPPVSNDQISSSLEAASQGANSTNVGVEPSQGVFCQLSLTFVTRREVA